MLTRNADLIRRLNILLGLSRVVDLDEIAPAEWDDLLDDLYWAIRASKKRVDDKKNPDVFHGAATPLGVRAAQEGLRGQLYQLRHAEPMRVPLLLENYPSFELAKQTVYLLADKDGFFIRYVSNDFPTMAYGTICLLIERLKLGPSDFLTCGYEKCQRVFVPLRKPHAATRRHFCSQKCGNLVSAREFRDAKKEQLKATEKKRNKRRSDSGYFELRRMKKDKAKSN